MANQHLYDFFKQLDRRLFLDSQYESLASLDRPLPIGYEQTISQPSLVLEMTELLDLQKHHKVLEIGTGSGYQTAFLAEFSQSVYTIELIPELSKQAKQRLKGLGYTNITFKIDDGSHGWQAHAPYDRIMVTASAQVIPKELTNQLATSGKMIIPIGECSSQELLLVTKDKVGQVQSQKIFDVRFVRLKGDYE